MDRRQRLIDDLLCDPYDEENISYYILALFLWMLGGLALWGFVILLGYVAFHTVL